MTHEQQHAANTALDSCPLRDASGRTAILLPEPLAGGIYEFHVVVDDLGPYPARGHFDSNADPDADRWLFLGRVDECPPSRIDAVRIAIEGWIHEGVVRLARWCRNRAFEHAWNAAAAYADAAA
ncbi:MAG: hypothetical protein JW839_02075, partial [Candidatus Lokiarchaeota archaeon]|nr:hypothetical protein [Candidatus Lokiarchaeota archaeon]